MRQPALTGILQNRPAPRPIDHTPLLDFLDGSEAAETDQVVVEAAIADAG
jgi:hypothetical protein